MSNSCVLPLFSIDEISAFLEQRFGIVGSVIPLNGERDLNFKVVTNSGVLVFKVANIEEDSSLLDCQNEIFTLMEDSGLGLDCCKTVLSLSSKAVEFITDKDGNTHLCRLVSFIDGRLFSDIKPHTDALLENLGYQVAGLNMALQDFKHTAIERPLIWNMMDASETISQFQELLDSPSKRELVAGFHKRFEQNVLPISNQLRVGAIHNDINDNNIVVEDAEANNQTIKGFIDFGDIVYSWVIVDLAVACAYALLNKDRPLDAVVAVLKGYQRRKTLTETEVSVLFDLICMRLCLSVCICAHQKSIDPDNHYLSISERPAWVALEKLSKLNIRFVYYLFRHACDMQPVPQTPSIQQWITDNSDQFHSIVNINLSQEPLLFLDTSVGSPFLPNPSIPFDPDLAERDLFRTIEDGGFVAAIGRYDEYRLVYNSDDFTDETGHRRTLHLGIDIFQRDGSEIYAPLNGEVFGVANNDSPLDYGGTIILKHKQFHDEEVIEFYTLYGHLRPSSVMKLKVGEKIQAGGLIGVMGDTSENGNWPPHVHFEIITDMLGYEDTFVGVGTHAHRNVWLNLCPDPSTLLGLRGDTNRLLVTDPDSLRTRIFESRSKNLNPSLSLSYDTPIHMVRGDAQYMFDFTGRRYLDAVNNVPHVGHSHPKVVQAAISQTKILNTNTRYLYNQIENYSEKLLRTFPKPLEVCYLVNSGSEANDLALRLATNYTQKQDRIILDHAYHGNLSSLIDISPYKHNGNGGLGAPNYVHTALIPDVYRGEHLDDIQKYIESVEQAIARAVDQNGLAFFIAESVLGCGGQVVLPDGYLSQVYDKVRAVGGLCIADEVQVGLGRVGSHTWAFETQAVVPDIVTLGKPMGNGHALAAVITTREIAESFNNGMEYFNTFGGNPVSCAIGLAVLEVLEEEQLQTNALDVGAQFIKELSALKSQFEIIGDVRGLGLFLGVELVNTRDTLNPAAKQASYIVERMKQNGILISTDGPLHNVLKIKPPMCFNQANVAQFISTLEKVLQEDYAQVEN